METTDARPIARFRSGPGSEHATELRTATAHGKRRTLVRDKGMRVGSEVGHNRGAEH